MDFTLRPSDAPRARELGRELGLSPSMGQVLLHRGLDTVEAARAFGEASLAGLSDPSPMVGRTEAAERLVRAVRKSERIAVFGDYDVDGTTATTLLVTALRELGADVVGLAAQRFAGGYGFSDPALARVRASGATVLVTCDCGSADHPRIADATRSGIDVIVVDHHLVPSEPLPALAFLNPHRPECGFAYKGMASVGLAFLLVAAIRRELRPSFDIRPYLDLVALGTVADVAPLDGDNRRMVRAGLARLSNGSRPGVVALRELAKAHGQLGGADIAFRLAPRLNAAGRLADASLTLALLGATTLEEARAAGREVEALNAQRRSVQEANTEDAVRQVRAIYGDRVEGGIVVASPDWHRGVVGIVAARLVDLFECPAIVIAIEPDGHAHGSGRTLGDFPLHDAVRRSSASLTQMGGHQAALGVHLDAGSVERFRADFDNACRELRARGIGRRTKLVDVHIDGATFRLPKAAELAFLEPVGAGNPEPRFLLESVKVEQASSVGTGHLKLGLRVGGETLSAFGYGMGDRVETLAGKATLIGTLRPDSWRGGDAVELKIDDLRPA